MTDITPSFNTWTSLFLLAVAQGIFITILLYTSSKANRQANFYLGTLVLTFALTLLDYVGYWSYYNWYFPHLTGIYQLLVFLLGPLLYLYFYNLEKRSSLLQICLHFTPFLLFIIYKIPYFSLSAADKRLFFTGQERLGKLLAEWEYWPNLTAWQWLFFLTHLSVYAVLIFKQFYPKHQATTIAKRWFSTLWGLYTAFTIAYIAYFVMLKTGYYQLTYDYLISLVMTIFIYTVGFLGYRQPSIFAGTFLAKAFQTEKYSHSSLTPSGAASLHQKLLQTMEQEQYFLDNDLRLHKLAEHLQTTPHHLSQVLNERIGKSYSEFINGYRIAAAQKLLSDPKEQNTYIINIAYQVGFNNKTSFNQAFKAISGVSPSAYRKEVLQTNNSI